MDPYRILIRVFKIQAYMNRLVILMCFVIKKRRKCIRRLRMILKNQYQISKTIKQLISLNMRSMINRTIRNR